MFIGCFGEFSLKSGYLSFSSSYLLIFLKFLRSEFCIVLDSCSFLFLILKKKGKRERKRKENKKERKRKEKKGKRNQKS